MLPDRLNFAKKIIAKMAGGEEVEEDALSAAADELVAADTNKDGKAVAAAMRSAFHVLDSEPRDDAGEESP